ncbi:hypothetical protein CLOM_g5251 [Closterium sp. NIES-68]|nr:hypothetical protein CLOM_g5251 [Closterium sp. NIES-68]GJP67591.1 hypothetical protein CLOP_g24396 [Closterium sp. NIES-67]
MAASPSLRAGISLVVLLVAVATSSSHVAASSHLADFVKTTVKSHPVVVFSKSYCPYCRRAKAVFQQLNVVPHVVELDQRDDGQEIQDVLMDIVGRRTVPQVFVGGEHIGGADDTADAFAEGTLRIKVRAAVNTHSDL